MFKKVREEKELLWPEGNRKTCEREVESFMCIGHESGREGWMDTCVDHAKLTSG
jgi:hypothetical protein